MTKIMLYGAIGDCCDGLEATTVVAQITAANDTIEVHINSAGGNIVEGLAIFNALMRAKDNGRKVDIYIDGLAASMASVIACAGDEIFMAENALIMIHNPWDGIYGDAADLRAAADRLDLLRDQIVGIYAKRTGIAIEALKAMMDAETWLDAASALEQNFITGVLAATYAMNSIDLTKFGYRKVPVHPLVAAKAAAGTPAPAAAGTPQEENAMTDLVNTPAAPGNAAPIVPPITIDAVNTTVTTAVNAATAAERTRIAGITELTAKHGIDSAAASLMVTRGDSIETARAAVLDVLATRGDSANVGHQPAIVTRDGRDKWMAGAMANILLRSGQGGIVQAAAKLRGETIDLDPGEFRGVTMVQLAAEALTNAGIKCNSRDPMQIVGQAFTARNSGGVFQGIGDFPLLLENAMHKVLQAAYLVTPDTWSRFAGIGSVSDFRAHRRYLLGTFGTLDSLNELGEFKNKVIPEGARESITATTKGNIISLSRQAIVSDDIGAFTSLAAQLGRAAKLSVEVDVYGLVAANPVMSDGFALFSAQHGNLGTAAAPSVAAFDEARVQMASQRDVSGNEVLNITPAYWLGAMGLGGLARVVNGAQYDPTAGTATGRPNIALGIFQDIVDTARLTGNTWYTFADKLSAPAIEVAFLNGQAEPFADSNESWRMDGTEWKVRHDYGVAAVNWRSATRNVGA